MTQINTKEDVFFSDHADQQKLRTFKENLFGVNEHYFLKYQQQLVRELNEENNFVYNRQLGIFKTFDYARDYFNQMTDSQEPIRLASRIWNQQHQILSQAVIINLNNNETTSLLDCLENVCERFGGSCNETNGCSTVPFAKEYAKNKKLFPIKVVAG